jgi:rRNA maturation endonuclease Nob1
MYYSSTGVTTGTGYISYSTNTTCNTLSCEPKYEYFSNHNISESSISNIETGRIEKGKESSQSFTNDYGDYSSLVQCKSEYIILPRSLKPLEISEIREYCPSCRNRIKKKTWKFCPSCGESLEN